ncbi:MAG: MarR family transcriptional regulator [Verrucomicrobia bacterium]|nr:MarR family transcriptional regulator [Verrucomicrobiota bacterium]
MRAPKQTSSHLLTKAEYEMLARFRYHLRRFLQFSQEAAQTAGVTPRQYQALLAIKGFPDRDFVTVGELAEQLQIVHHAAVELINRLAAQNLVERQPDPDDRRKVLVKLSRSGTKVLGKVSAAHRLEIRRLGPGLLPLLESLVLDRETK